MSRLRFSSLLLSPLSALPSPFALGSRPSVILQRKSDVNVSDKGHRRSLTEASSTSNCGCEIMVRCQRRTEHQGDEFAAIATLDRRKHSTDTSSTINLRQNRP